MSNAIVPGSNGGTSIQRDGFGERALERRHETASTAVAAQAQAEIQARYIVAAKNPRDWDDVRARLLKECARTSFADRALYALPRGNKKDERTGEWIPNVVEGLTVRFAEAMIRISGNVRQSTSTIYDDDDMRIVRVSVIDLESNGEYSRDVVLEKTVERSKAGDRVPISSRMNSYNKPVFLLEATEDEMAEKEGRMVSKAFRTLALRFLPADIIEDCNTAIRETRSSGIRKDPMAAKKGIADSFASINVYPADLKAYLGHELDTCSPPELEHLRGLFAAIRGGDATWAEALSEKTADEGKEQAKTVAEKLEERKAAKKGKEAPAKAAAPTATTPATHSPSPSAPATAQPKNEKPPSICVVCTKPISFTDPCVASRGPSGPGWRHSSCSPFGAVADSDSEPPEDVETVGREPGED